MYIDGIYIYVYYPPQINGYPHIVTIDFADQLSASKKGGRRNPEGFQSTQAPTEVDHGFVPRFLAIWS